MVEESNNANYIPLIQAVITGVLSFTGALLAVYLGQFFQRRNERASIKSAFRGEIAALLSLVTRRGYIEGLEEDLVNLRNGLPGLTTMRISGEVTPIFTALSSKIGLLETPLPENLVTFYTYLMGAVEDFREIAEGNVTSEPIPVQIFFAEELLGICRDAKSLASQLLEDLR